MVERQTEENIFQKLSTEEESIISGGYGYYRRGYYGRGYYGRRYYRRRCYRGGYGY